MPEVKNTTIEIDERKNKKLNSTKIYKINQKLIDIRINISKLLDLITDLEDLINKISI